MYITREVGLNVLVHAGGIGFYEDKPGRVAVTPKPDTSDEKPVPKRTRK